MVDIPGDQSTTATISVGGTASDQLETVGDHDWFAITLTASQAVTISLNGITLHDPYLYVRDSTGALLFENDDVSSVNFDSRLAFNPAYSGTYYIDVGAFDDFGTGQYQVSVDPYTFPPVATPDQIADQLVSGYWDGDSHHWNVAEGGTLTVNITDLGFAEKTLARAALAAWSDIIGVHFQEVSGAAQITFSNDEGPEGLYAATTPQWSGGIMTAATVQISTSWMTAFGSTLNSYGFETYVHEVGHALGLGHAGNYNFDARYPYDALFANDALPMSVMSYFDATDVFYFRNQNFTDANVMTPMNADILAMQALYGLSTSTSPGNTTYGFNSNALNPAYHADLYPNVAYTIFDTGGVDTFDFSNFSGAQIIDLGPEQFSSVLGNGGTISIARGVIVENAVGGSGADVIRGNIANNILIGGDGDDSLVGMEGDDILIGGPGDDRLSGTEGFDTVSYAGAGVGITMDNGNVNFTGSTSVGWDQLFSIEHVIGSAFADDFKGYQFSDEWLEGGSGNDKIDGGLGNDTVDGGEGDDIVIGGSGIDILTGGNGSDLFEDTAAGLNGDTLTDFARSDRILIRDAPAGQALAWSNGQLTYGSASITLSNLSNASITTEAAPQGGVQIIFGGPAIVVAGGSSAAAAQSSETAKLASSAPALDETIPPSFALASEAIFSTTTASLGSIHDAFM